MRRCVLLGALVLAFALFGLVGPAFAAADDDIPGTPLTIGSTISQTVGPGDVSDVYAVTLTAGHEVHIRCDPGTTSGPKGSLHLLVPGASSITDPDDYDEMIYTLSGGSFIRYWADYDYIPAKSGTYYLWVEWEAGTLDYELSVVRTSRPALNLAPESDDIPGTAIGSGAVTGVVSTKADPDDVYAVGLTAGQPVTIRLMPLVPLNSGWALAYLNLLDPATTSISKYYGHTLGTRELAENNEDAASRKTAEIQYTPTQTGTYYVWVEAGGVLYGYDFAYQLSISGGNSGPHAPPGDFSDVAGSPYETAIYDLADRGIVTGFEDGTFRPSSTVTRQQFAKMIVKTLGLTVTGSEVCPFGDVGGSMGSDPFYPDKYVAVCAAHGVTQGKTATTFAPYDDITRQQLISMVARAADLPEAPAGYAPGFSSGQFYPDEHYINARKAAYAGLLEGLQGVGPSYDFFAASARGECAQMLYNLLETQGADSTATVWMGGARFVFADLTECTIGRDVFNVEGKSADGSLWLRIRHASPPTRQPAEPSFASLDIGGSPDEQPASVFAGYPAGVTFGRYDPAQGIAEGEAWGTMNGENAHVLFRVECRQDLLIMRASP
ncbi:MAG: S-layer homology domain-containing protein [bacterium]